MSFAPDGSVALPALEHDPAEEQFWADLLDEWERGEYLPKPDPVADVPAWVTVPPLHMQWPDSEPQRARPGKPCPPDQFPIDIPWPDLDDLRPDYPPPLKGWECDVDERLGNWATARQRVYRRAEHIDAPTEAFLDLVTEARCAYRRVVLDLETDDDRLEEPRPTGTNKVLANRAPGRPKAIREDLSRRFESLRRTYMALLDAAFCSLGGQELGRFLALVHESSSGALMEHAGLAFERTVAEQGVQFPRGRNYADIDPEGVTVDTVAAEHGIGRGVARQRCIIADRLPERFPAMWNLCQFGHLDEFSARIILQETERVEDTAALEGIEQDLFNALIHYRGTRMGPRPLRELLRRLVDRYAPEAGRERKAKCDEDRFVEFVPFADGVTAIQGDLPSAHAEVIEARLDQLVAAWSQEPGEKRTARQLRADALLALALGLTEDGRSLPPPDLAIRLQCVTSDTAPLGFTTWTSRGSAVTPERLAELLREATKVSATVTGPMAAPSLNELLERANKALIDMVKRLAEVTAYKPSAEVARRVRLRDGTCRHPGCNVPADLCDLDHGIPYCPDDPLSGGLTTEENLQSLCRTHHRGKTHGKAEYRLDPDGAVSYSCGSTGPHAGAPRGPLGVVRANLNLLYDANVRMSPERISDFLATMTGLLEQIREKLGS